MATLIIILLGIVIAILLYKNLDLQDKINTYAEADVWHKLAFYDDLTGLLNRTAYNQKMDQLEEKCAKNSITIVLFDIDDFKQINDTMGHLAGDMVLKKVGAALTKIFNTDNFKVYRIGGDEFAIIAENTDAKDIEDLFLKLNEFEEYEGIYLSKGYAVVKNSLRIAFTEADKKLYKEKIRKKVRR